MSKELYINGRQIDLPVNVVIALTKQVNDIAELADRQADYSNTFFVNNTSNNDLALQFSNTIQTNSNAPYRRLPATYIQNGEPIIENGIAVISNAQNNGYNITLYSGIYDFFSQLGDLTMKDIDWSYLNHTYNIAAIKTRNENYLNGAYDVCWPLINYGAYKTNQDVDIKYQQPAIRKSAIIDRIFALTDYSKSGDIFNEGIYLDSALTLSQDEEEITEDQIQDRSFWAGLTTPLSDLYLPSQGGPSITNLITAFEDTNAPGYNAQGLIIRDNKPKTIPWPQAFNPSAINLSDARYVSKTYTSIEISARFTFQFLNVVGIDSYKIFKNGRLIHNVFLSSQNGPIPSPLLFQDVYAIDTKPGDDIRIQLYASDFYIPLEGKGTQYLKITAKSSSNLFGPIDYNILVPELKLKDIIRTFCQKYALILTPSKYGKVINFTKFKQIKGNIANAEDWSKKLDKLQGSNIEFKLGNYAKNNYLKYKSDEFTNGYGDSSFAVDNQNLAEQATMFELIYPSALPEDNIRTTSKVFTIPTDEYFSTPQWQSSSFYTVGQEVAINFIVYVCIANTIVPNTNPENTIGVYFNVKSNQYISNGSNQGVKIDRYTLYQADTYDAEKEYSVGDEVNYLDVIYVSLQNDNIGKNPKTELGFWEPRALQYEQTISNDCRMVLIRKISPINPNVSPGDPINYTDGTNTVSSDSSNYLMAYFGDPTQSYNLTFQYLIPTYYQEIILMLIRLKVLYCYMRLTEKDIQELDFLLLKYIGDKDNYFYLNRVEDYIEGQSAQCQLIRI